MNELAYAGVTLAVAAGLSLAVYHYWHRRKAGSSLLLFLLPMLAYFLWHFSVEAYEWGEVWATAKVVTLELDIAVALIDLKLLFTVFMLLAWIYVWNSVNTSNRREGRK